MYVHPSTTAEQDAIERSRNARREVYTEFWRWLTRR